MNDCEITGKTDPSDPIRREFFWMRLLKTIAPLGLILMKVKIINFYLRFISILVFDMLWLSGNISHDGYKVIRADHPSNTKRGGVCIYYKGSLSVRALNLTNLSERIVKDIFMLYIDLQAKTLPYSKNFCQALRTFWTLLHQPAFSLMQDLLSGGKMAKLQ